LIETKLFPKLSETKSVAQIEELCESITKETGVVITVIDVGKYIDISWKEDGKPINYGLKKEVLFDD